MMSVTVHGLQKSFDDLPVLVGVDLEVAQASTTAVLGPSGCGKTTLLRLVAGFLRPDAGMIRLGGELVADPTTSVPTERRRVGYVAQEGALFPHLDVTRNITFGLDRRGRRSGRRVEELLELVGLPAGVARRYPHELSGGQQQRVAVARALAPEPRVVLLDEPFSSLDAGLREETGRAVIQALQASGATAILVTHDQDEALSLADQVAVMRAGRVAQVGTPREVYEAPVDRGVAEFVGAAVVLPAEVAGATASSALGDLPLTGDLRDGGGLVLVRPEQIELASVESAGLRARVVEVGYHGHDASVRLRLEPADVEVLARLAGSAAPSVGELVGVTVHGPARLL
ncbi:MAG TPA: ABC transporter ATP-binding protein [Angustibacter sp.]|nr:ABC transporter ATP-binding protein [Angustibacter sp.]